MSCSESELDSNFVVNSSESDSESESEFDSSSAFMNLDICIFFILHLHSSKETYGEYFLFIFIIESIVMQAMQV